MSRQNKQKRVMATAHSVTAQHKAARANGTKARIGNPAPKHNKVNRLNGSTNHIGFKKH